MRSILYALSIGICLFSAHASSAQCRKLAPDSLQLVTDESSGNTILAMETYGDTVYMGGSFTMLAKYTGALSAVNMISGDAINQPTFPKVNGRVRDVVRDANGDYIICGQFTHVNGFLRRGIAKILANGQVSSWDPNQGSLNYWTDDVYTGLGVYGNMVIVAGYYDVLNGNHYSPCGLDINTGQVIWYPGNTSMSQGESIFPLGGNRRLRVRLAMTI